MLKCAKKYGVEFDTVDPSHALLEKLPLWHHFGEDASKVQINNSDACVCLRENHGVLYIRDGLVVLNRLTDNDHRRSPTCRCVACSDDRQIRGCANPHACTSAVENKLSRILPKWDP
ncbi:hypothetical protein C8R44DRAFT_590595, partial [Mycena epipterygia]